MRIQAVTGNLISSGNGFMAFSGGATVNTLTGERVVCGAVVGKGTRDEQCV